MKVMKTFVRANFFEGGQKLNAQPACVLSIPGNECSTFSV